MKPKSISLSIFFPAYNEEANIAESVKAAQEVAQSITDTYEIIIINDGSADKTGSIADNLSAKDPKHIRVIHHKANQGYGAAVWSGIQAARYDYIFFTDADLQFDLQELKKLTAYVPEYKVVLGYRAKRRDPFMRLLNAKGWNILNRFLFGLRVRDIDCAFKLFERQTVVTVPIQSRGAMMSAELLIYLQRQGVTFKEVPVKHLPRKAGSPTGAKAVVILWAFKELLQTYRGDLGNVTHRQLVKFTTVGIINTVLDLLVYIALTRLTGLFHNHALWAKAASYLIASVSSFFLNRTWTFRRKEPITLRKLGRFYITVGTALIINVISLFVFLRLFHFIDLPAAILATFTTLAWNFILARFWVFTVREKSPKKSIYPVDIGILCLLIAVLLSEIVGWLHFSDYPPHWDMAKHLYNSLIYTDIMRSIIASQTWQSLTNNIFLFYVKRSVYYPPLAYWVSVPFILTFGRTIAATVMSNVVFIIILVFSIYGVGKILWNRTTGLLAAVLIVTYPFIASQFHEFQLDMPLTAMVLFSLWGLLKTEHFQKQVWSFAFGVIVALGMLTKWTLPAFLVGPVGYELIGALYSINHRDAAHKGTVHMLLWGLALGLLGIIVVAGPWYIGHWHSLHLGFVTNVATGTEEGDPRVWSIESLRYYYQVLLVAQVRLPYLLLFCIGLIHTLSNRLWRAKNGMLLTFILSSYIIMTLYNNKDYRFIEPILGGMAILSVYWVTLLPRPVKAIGILGLMVLATAQFLTVNWGAVIFPNLPREKVIMIPDLFVGKTLVRVYVLKGYTSGSPIREDWQQKNIIQGLISNTASRGKNTPGPANVVAMYYNDNPWFNRENLSYYVAQSELPISILDKLPVKSPCQSLDYIIITSDQPGYNTLADDFPYYTLIPPSPGDIRSTTSHCHFSLIQTITLPNSLGVKIWKVSQ